MFFANDNSTNTMRCGVVFPLMGFIHRDPRRKDSNIGCTIVESARTSDNDTFIDCQC